jgi:hypothetical protein
MNFCKKAIIFSSLLFPALGYSQPNGVSVTTETIRIQLKPVVSSMLETTSDTWNTFVFQEANAYKYGLEKKNAAALSVRSNQTWVVTVRTEDDFFQGQGNQLPANILSVQANDGEYINLSSQPIVISQSNDQSVSERVKRIQLSYKARPGAAQDTGNYSIKLIFTVSSK